MKILYKDKEFLEDKIKIDINIDNKPILKDFIDYCFSILNSIKKDTNVFYMIEKYFKYKGIGRIKYYYENLNGFNIFIEEYGVNIHIFFTNDIFIYSNDNTYIFIDKSIEDYNMDIYNILKSVFYYKMKSYYYIDDLKDFLKEYSENPVINYENLIKILKTFPYIRLSHPKLPQLDCKYIYSNLKGEVLDNDNYIIEDWENIKYDFIRSHNNGLWKDNWKIIG